MSKFLSIPVPLDEHEKFCNEVVGILKKSKTWLQTPHVYSRAFNFPDVRILSSMQYTEECLLELESKGVVKSDGYFQWTIV